MRRGLRTGCVFLILLFLLNTTSCGRNEDFRSAIRKRFGMRCDAAFRCDFDTGETEYFVGSADTAVRPASITKLLTALAALEILPADTVIQPGGEVFLPPDGSSFAFIRPQHRLTLRMLVEGMLIPSGGDAAYAAAAACGFELTGGTAAGFEEAIAAFMAYLNEYAVSLGCTDTHFTSPDGYAGDEHTSTAGDMMKICLAAADNALIAEICAIPYEDVVYASGHTNSWKNTNRMLDSESPYYNENVIGLKTGSLERNYSLAVLSDDGEHRFLVGVFGAGSDRERYEIARILLDEAD